MVKILKKLRLQANLLYLNIWILLRLDEICQPFLVNFLSE
jgi:hypothetical protein